MKHTYACPFHSMITTFLPQALRDQVQKFTMDLVDETRTCTELEIVLNYDPEGEPYKKGEFMHLVRLREAVASDQKEVSVAGQ